MQNPVEPEKFLKMHPEIILPPDEEKAWLATRTGAIVGRRTAERFHWKIGDKVPIRSTIWSQADGSQTWTFDIVGIYDGKDKGTDTTPLFFRYDYFDEARQPGARDRSAGTPSASRTRRRRRKWPNGWTRNLKIRRRKPRRSRKARSSRAGPAKSATSSSSSPRFLSAVFFTILLVTGNTMAQAVRERTGELGVLKAIGFTNGQVVALVLAESCLLTVLGGVVGLGLARADHTGHGTTTWPACCRCSFCPRAICSSGWASASRWAWSPEFFPRSRPCACASRTP